MDTFDELESIGRIVLAIKTYRHQTADLQSPQNNDSLSAYLQVELSVEDWQLWQTLRAEEVETSQALSSRLPERLGAIMDFQQLISQYKRIER